VAFALLRAVGADVAQSGTCQGREAGPEAEQDECFATLQIQSAHQGGEGLGAVQRDPAPPTVTAPAPPTVTVPEGPPVGVSEGVEISQSLWQSMYDFIVYIEKRTIPPDGWVHSCTGTVWGNMVLTAAHCGFEPDVGESTITVTLATGKKADVINHAIHPKYAHTKEGGLHPYDVMLLTLNETYENKEYVYLQSSTPKMGTALNVGGFGEREPGKEYDANRPVVTKTPMSVVACEGEEPPFLCASSGPDSGEAACSGDSGSAWFTVERKGYMYVAGVHSGNGGNGATCGSNSKYSVFTPTGTVKNWIQSQTDVFKWPSY